MAKEVFGKYNFYGDSDQVDNYQPIEKTIIKDAQTKLRDAGFEPSLIGANAQSEFEDAMKFFRGYDEECNEIIIEIQPNNSMK